MHLHCGKGGHGDVTTIVNLTPVVVIGPVPYHCMPHTHADRQTHTNDSLSIELSCINLTQVMIIITATAATVIISSTDNSAVNTNATKQGSYPGVHHQKWIKIVI